LKALPYISLLRGLDEKVYYNKSERTMRPYVGVMLQAGSHKYRAPLTSYKPKQETFKASDPRYFKIVKVIRVEALHSR
jgi:protein AbiQ